MSLLQYSKDARLRKGQKFCLWTVLGIGGVVVFGLLFGYLVQFLWNATLAELFGFPALSFWQALGLFVLAKLFFGFGGGGGGSNRTRQRKRRDGSGCAEPDTVEDIGALTTDETFRTFWKEEGKASYEAFRAAQREGDPESTPGQEES